MESISGNPAGVNLFQQVSNQGQVNQTSSATPAQPATPTNSNADTVNISQQAQDLLAAENSQPAPPPETAALNSSGAENGAGPK